MKKLAINGGKKLRNQIFPKYPIITRSEENAVLQVLRSGNLSTFVASPGKNFLGGVKIQIFEKNFAKFLGVKFAVAFNSATSALHAAVVSVGVKPEDEVIVPPYTFTSTATSVLMHNAVPVFSDVDKNTYCINPNELEKVKTNRTRAIIPVHLFGNSCDMDKIMKFARKNNLYVIEDCAQSPGGEYKNKKLGSIGDCGIFSFQETKNMMTGEGGMLVTNNEKIANIARMVRNHGEVISFNSNKRNYRPEILGWGYRMTELEAAIGIVQLKKLNQMNNTRIKLSEYLAKKINTIDGLKHHVSNNVKHVYYVFAFSFDQEKIGINRNIFCEAIRAEGIPMFEGYVKPLYLNPLYEKKLAYVFKNYKGKVKYEKGICPIAEDLHFNKLILTPVCRPPATKHDMDDIFNSILKVIKNKDELKTFTSF